MKPINIYDEIAEAERELKAKQQYYPKWIDQQKIRPSVAEYRICCNLKTLKRLYEIRAKHESSEQPSLFEPPAPLYTIEQVTKVVRHYAMTDIPQSSIKAILNSN